jgi:HK97 gp10 family phage protein
MMRIRLDGSRELQVALREAGDDVRAEAGRVVQEAAAELEGAVKLKIQQGQKTGRIYTRGKVRHRASAPGQSPASDTGTLLGSIHHERITPMSAMVGSRLAYAAYLEYGTSRMAPRPYFRPAVEDIRPVFTARLEAAVAGALR